MPAGEKLLVCLKPLLLLLCLWGGSVVCPVASWAAPVEEDPEESDYPPGLLGSYQAGTVQRERIDSDISFHWGAGSPDERLPSGPFSVEWNGYLLLKSAAEYRFHAYLQGEVEVLVDDQVVLAGSAEEPQWISGEAVNLTFGEMPLEVRYRKTGSGAVVKLFWSSNQFAIEPISTHLLFREVGNPELAEVAQGRVEFRAWRCEACHAEQSAEEKHPAPALNVIAGGLSADWIVNKLTAPVGQYDHMPQFTLNQEQARDIAGYLLKNSQPVPKMKTPTAKKPAEELKKGELLVRSTGCLACHVINDLGTPGPFGGGELSTIGDKRSAAWLAHWLKQPAQLNAQHRMPLFQLSPTEIQQMALYLASLQGEEKPAATENAEQSTEVTAARGQELIVQFRCTACHQIPGIAPATVTAIPLQQPEPGPSCLSEETTATQPRFPQAPREALGRWVEALNTAAETSPKDPPTERSAFAVGQDLLLEKNCLACHSRDRHAGNVALAGELAKKDSRLRGQSQGLIPPHLTAVGDRLQDEALEKAVSGQQPRRLPWLSVRMPRFEHSTEEMAQLRQYLVGHDRLPDPIPDVRLQLANSQLSKSEELLLGRELSGGRAFNCIACHKMGDYEPRNTALGTKGSDLLTISSRLRPAYFLRWTMSPLRIVPGMEMPSFNQPRAGFAVHELDGQLSALWRAFGDSTFTAPSNPTVVEQYLTVGPDNSARVVRDVFEVKTGDPKQREFIPRPLAVGLPNGHSLLFDLDTAALRGWTYGDFAYQQTEGKSWYWYLAGAPVASQWQKTSNLALRAVGESEGQLIRPELSGVRRAFLVDYQTSDHGIQLEYLLNFTLPEGAATVRVQERWLPLDLPADSKQSGWQRIIECTEMPEGYQLVLSQQAGQVPLGEPVLRGMGREEKMKAGESLEWTAAAVEGRCQLSVDYLAHLTNRSTQAFPAKPEQTGRPENIEGIPGFQARRLPISSTIMPTALNWKPDGTLVFTSLKGHVFAARDSNSDGLPDQLQLIEEGLSAPFGILSQGNSLVIAHKPEILSLTDTDGTGRVYRRHVLADGWGHSDNYHDWITGFAEDAEGKLYLTSGSDYAQRGRPEGLALHRGEVMTIGPERSIQTVATELRYPIGIATDSKGRIFTSDQQGVQNCFNEINHILPGRGYGVPALNQKPLPEQRAAIQLPHPWTRSVNGIFFIPERKNLGGLSPFAGHGVGCEYNNRFLVRFSLQEVDGELQGACYELTRSIESLSPSAQLLVGPICGGIGPDGHIYVGSIHDSGWLGGQNTGEIVRLEVQKKLPNGIRELRAIPGGFELEFLEPVTADYLQNPENYDLSGYTRVWQGDYATPDSGRYRPRIQQIEVQEQGRIVRLLVDEIKPTFVYDLHLKNPPELFPASAYYTMNKVPQN